MGATLQVTYVTHLQRTHNVVGYDDFLDDFLVLKNADLALMEILFY